MARTNWLLNRGGRYYLQARVPQDLVPIIGKTFIKKSLRTSDRKEAVERLQVEAVEVRQQFAEAKRKLKAEVEKVAPKLTDPEAKRLAYLWFRQRERESVEEAFRQPELNPIAMENAFEELTVLLGDEDEFGPYVQQTADAVLISAGFPTKMPTPPPGPIRRSLLRPVPDIDKTSDAYKKLCERIRRGMIENVRRDQQRYRGRTATTIDPAFEPQRVEKAATGPLLSKILEMWLAERKPPEQTERDWRLATRRFTELHGDIAIDTITKAQVRDFKDALLQIPKVLPRKTREMPLPKIIATTKGTNQPTLSVNAVTKQLRAIKSLLSWSANNDYIEANPATGVSVAKAEEIADKRIAFDAKDLQSIFNGIEQHELYKKWITLLAAYTGARVGELIQLDVDDIGKRDGIDYVSINVENGKSVKTKSSVREVPVHHELVRCGFLDYVEGRRKVEDKRLFPDLQRGRQNRAVERFSKWFKDYRRSLGITDSRKPFHSFRHSFKQACRDAGITEEIHDALTGHSNGSVGRGYGGVSLKAKAEAINKVKYDVSLDHLYPK